MDSRSFDRLARSLAAPKSRRGLLGSISALGAALLGARAADAQQVTQAQCGNVVCGSDPGVCKPGCVCCTWSNGNSRCTPPGRCTAPGTVATTTTPAPCLAGTVRCDDGSCASLTDPIACGCARERCPVNETCVSGACSCNGGASAAPRTCCLGGGGPLCSDGDTGGLYANPANCFFQNPCPEGYTVCEGAVGTPGTLFDSCQACCPPGTTCDPRGFCRQ